MRNKVFQILLFCLLLISGNKPVADRVVNATPVGRMGKFLFSNPETGLATVWVWLEDCAGYNRRYHVSTSFWPTAIFKTKMTCLLCELPSVHLSCYFFSKSSKMENVFKKQKNKLLGS